MQVHIYKQIADRKKFVSFRNERTNMIFDARKLTVRTPDKIMGTNTRGVFVVLEREGDNWHAVA